MNRSRSYYDVAHGSAARLWAWTGRQLETADADRPHEGIWGSKVIHFYRGRFESVTLTVIVPHSKLYFMPLWLSDALEIEFGTAAEVLLFQ